MRAGLLVLLGCGRIAFDPHSDDEAFTPLALPPGGDATTITQLGSLADYYVTYQGGRVFHVTAGVPTECGTVPGSPIVSTLTTDGVLALLVEDDVGARDVWISDDACATFRATGLTAFAHSMVAVGAEIVVGTSGNGLWRYAGLWAQWPTPLDGDSVRGLAYDGRLTAGGLTTIGTFDGSTWRTATTSVGRNWAVAFDATNSQRIYVANEATLYVSNDGGTTFANLGVGMTLAIYADPATPDRLLRMTGGNLEQSVNAGVTWSSERRTAPLANSWVNDVAFDPMGSPAVLIASGAGLFRAEDTLLAWTLVPGQVTAPTINDVRVDGDTVLLGTDAGVLRSRAGAPFEVLSSWSAASSAVMRVSTSFTNPDRLYVVGTVMVRSDNAGQMFRELVPRSAADGWEYVGVVDGGASEHWAASRLRALYSTDDGTTWSAATGLGETNRFNRDLLVRASAPDETVLVSNLGVHWSTDRGRSYVAAASLAGEVWRVAELADGRVVVATDDGLWVTTSPTASWQRFGLTGVAVPAIAVSGDTIVAGSRDTVHYTHDAGATWRAISGDARNIRALAMAADGSLLVGTVGYGLFRVQLP